MPEAAAPLRPETMPAEHCLALVHVPLADTVLTHMTTALLLPVAPEEYKSTLLPATPLLPETKPACAPTPSTTPGYRNGRDTRLTFWSNLQSVALGGGADLFCQDVQGLQIACWHLIP